MPSFLDLGSRVCGVGPTEFVLGGTVIETERVVPIAGATGIGVPEGECALGRLFLFSAKENIGNLLKLLIS